jgi:hypothetical protein
MPNTGKTKFDHLTESDFRKPLEAKPTTVQDYAEALGEPASTVENHLKKRHPMLWHEIREELTRNRQNLRRNLKADPGFSAFFEEASEDRAHRAEVVKQSRDLESDVREEIGRKVQNLKHRVKELEERNETLSADLLSQENLVARVAAASTDPLPKPTFKTGPHGGKKKPERAVLLPIFDCQFGSKIVPDDTVGGLGEFNSDIFAERAKRYVRIVSEKIHAEAQTSRIGPIVFAIGGDTVEGDEIFSDQSWSLEMPPTDAVIQVRDWLAYIIEAIMEVGHAVGATHYNVVTTPGNHGKVGGRRKAGRPTNYNWDVMVYKLLEERLANFPLHSFVIEPGGNCAFEILGNPFAMIHGDEINSWGSIPFYGFTRYDAPHPQLYP